MKKLLLLEEELAASGNCEHWVKLEFSDGDYMVDVSATERISNADGEVGNAFPAIPINFACRCFLFVVSLMLAQI